MIVVERWWLGVTVSAVMAALAACSSGSSSSSTTSTTSGTGGSTSSTSGTGGSTSSTSGTGGAGGSTTTTTSGTGGSTTTSGTGGTGGVSDYTCNTCLDPSPGAGAKAKECKAQGDACFQNKSCVSLFSCTYSGTVDGMGNPVGPCDNSAAGACCTFQCYDLIKSIAGDAAGQEAIDLYEALDQCTTCGVCKSVCGDGATAYCAAYAAGPAACN